MMDARGTGRTTQMVLGLPKTGCVVFVHHKGLVPYVRDLVTMHHGVRVSEGVHVLAAPTVEDEERLMAGRPCDLPVFRDHALVERRALADEPMVPRRDGAIFATAPREAILSDQTRIGPQRCTKCGTGSPGWCKDMLCARRPVSADKLHHYLGDLGLTISPATVRPSAPAEVSLGAAPQILDLMEAGFTFTEASGLTDADRDLYAQLVRGRARQRERERSRRAPVAYA